MATKSTASRTIAANARRIAREKKISQTALGKRLDRSQSQISRKLLGQVPMNIDELEQLAAALGVTLNDLLAGTDAPQDSASKVSA